MLLWTECSSGGGGVIGKTLSRALPLRSNKNNYLLTFWPLCFEAQPENMVTPQVAGYHHTKILAMARGIGSVSSPLGIQHAQGLPIEVEHDQSN